MSNSVFLSKIKFLSDENVDERLKKYLIKQGLDIISKPKELSNGKLAEFSKSEKRVLVTNDSDFTDPWTFPREKIFSVIWLRIPQDKLKSAIDSFSKLIKDPPNFEGNLIILYEASIDVKRIPSRVELKLSPDSKAITLI